MTGRGAGKGGRGGPALPGFSVQTFFSSVSCSSGTLGRGAARPAPPATGKETARGSGPGPGTRAGRSSRETAVLGVRTRRASGLSPTHPWLVREPGLGTQARSPRVRPALSVPSPPGVGSPPRVPPRIPVVPQPGHPLQTDQDVAGRTGNGRPLGPWPANQAVTLQQERGSPPKKWDKPVGKESPRKEPPGMTW